MAYDDYFISADALEQTLGASGLRIVDASWYIPAQGRNARAEYDAAHISGTVFFDQDAIADISNALPHTLPTAEFFAQQVGALGIAADHQIVIYDGPGLFSAPRVAWMFRMMGAKNVRLLEGGFDRWKAAGRPVVSEPSAIAPASFMPNYDDSKVLFLDAMRNVVSEQKIKIADARSNGRFSGQEAEPRAGMRAGHMPGAVNVFFMNLQHDGVLKSADELAKIFKAAGIDPHDHDQAVVTTCGSGVTAAVVAIALDVLGNQNHQLYDGSWSEWGGLTDTPIETQS